MNVIGSTLAADEKAVMPKELAALYQKRKRIRR